MKTKLIYSALLAAALSAGPAFGAEKSATPSKDTTTTTAPAKTDSTSESLQKWDDQIFAEMHQFETRMDSLFNDARQFINTEESANQLPGNFNSAVNIQDEANQYVIRFALPNTEMEKAKVTLKDGVLDVTANEQTETYSNWKPESSAPAQPSSRNAGKPTQQAPPEGATIHYEQMISLPGSVDAASMKIERSAGFVTVTLTKSATPSKSVSQNTK